jgi:type VI protein secretion system component VasK
MSIIYMILPFIARFKAVLILLTVFVVSYLACSRWSNTLSPAWLYMGTAVGVTALVLLIVWFVGRRRAKNSESGLEAGLSATEGDKVDLKGEIQALRENWLGSIQKLKDSTDGAGTATLSRLPWYIILGEPASGKSTLLRKSGLDFPVGDASVTGLHGTRNCDWWFANEAIFLDTAGRYIIETQQAEWVAFLNLLKKHRKKKPINGVMVALPANSLLTKSEEELAQDGKRIRARVDQLIDLLGINFPVYVLVTKVDLVAGFRETYRSLDAAHAAQMVGWTNPTEGGAHFDAKAFDQKFAEVTERIYRMRPWRESQANRLDLAKTFLFPEEFQYLARPLRSVLDVVFQSNIYQETPICRGVYFSSGTQVGGPLAKALEDMARDLNLPADFGAGLDVPDDTELRAYFIRDLVSGQVLRDKDMTWRTRRSEIRVLSRRRKWGIISLAAMLLLGLGAGFSWMANRTRLSDFALSLKEGARPLEASADCIDARDEAVRPGITDIGLNFSDEIIPSADKAFRKVFGEGCIVPAVAAIRTDVKAGLPRDDQNRPDLNAYRASFARFEYLRQGLSGKLPETYEPKVEEQSLNALQKTLREAGKTGEAGPADLRRVLREYGSEEGGFVHFPLEEQKKIRDEYDRNVAGYLDGVEKWVNRNLDTTGKIKADVESAVAGLAQTCSKRRAEIARHNTPRLVLDIAKEMMDVADPTRTGGSAPGQTNLDDLAAGVGNRKDLQTMLLALKAETTADSGIPGRVDALLGKLDLSTSTGGMKKRHRALEGIVTFLDGIRSGTIVAASFDTAPTREDLLARQKEIRREIECAGGKTPDQVWNEQLKEHVEALADGPVEETVDGETTRKSGWWDSLLLLAQARRADLRAEEYITAGLMPYLEGKGWFRDRSSDREWEVLSRARLDETVLPRLREQLAFFDNPAVAVSVRDKAVDLIRTSLDDFLTRMEEYWLRIIMDAIPKKTVTDISEIGDRLGLWSDERGKLLMAIDDIRTRVSGISRLEGPEGDALLDASKDHCTKIFEEFAFFFDPADPDVRKHYTSDAAAADLRPFVGQFEEVASGFGSGQRSRARDLTALLMEKGTKSSYSQALRVMKDLKREGRTSRSVSKIGKWLEPQIRMAWTTLVNLAAADVNTKWERLRDEWNRTLRGADPGVFLKIFGPGGTADQFEQKYLKPYFDLTDYTPTPADGTMLEVTGAFRAFRTQAGSLKEGVFGADGGYRKDGVKVGLKIGGTRATSLVVEYRTSDGKESSRERRTDNVAVAFEFNWSPETCKGFGFVVGFPGDKTRTIDFKGAWAVAKAFAACDRVSGNTYVWSRSDPEVGDYEVILTVQDGGLGSLCSTYTGEDPLEKLANLLPKEAVMVRE